MAAMTYYLRNNLLNHVTHAVAYTPPANLWLALFTTETTPLGGGTEVAGGSYVRRVLSFTGPAGGSETTNADVFFPTATVAWGNVTHMGIFDNSVAGNMLFYGKLNTPSYINVGNTFEVASGILVLSLN